MVRGPLGRGEGGWECPAQLPVLLSGITGQCVEEEGATSTPLQWQWEQLHPQ